MGIDLDPDAEPEPKPESEPEPRATLMRSVELRYVSHEMSTNRAEMRIPQWSTRNFMLHAALIPEKIRWRMATGRTRYRVTANLNALTPEELQLSDWEELKHNQRA